MGTWGALSLQAVQPVAERASGGLLWGSSRTTTEPAPSGVGVLDKALDIWHTTRDKLLDIEAKMVVQVGELPILASLGFVLS
jgi:hypothetical protein